MNFFVDSSFLIALYHKKDNFHLKALKLAKETNNKKAFYISSNIVMAETINFVFRKMGPKYSKKIYQLIEKSNIKIINISRYIFNKGYQYLFQQKSKKGANLFDCFYLATMKYFKIKNILTFDKDFKNQGLKIFGLE